MFYVAVSFVVTFVVNHRNHQHLDTSHTVSVISCYPVPSRLSFVVFEMTFRTLQLVRVKSPQLFQFFFSSLLFSSLFRHEVSATRTPNPAQPHQQQQQQPAVASSPLSSPPDSPLSSPPASPIPSPAPRLPRPLLRFPRPFSGLSPGLSFGLSPGPSSGLSSPSSGLSVSPSASPGRPQPPRCRHACPGRLPQRSAPAATRKTRQQLLLFGPPYLPPAASRQHWRPL